VIALLQRVSRARVTVDEAPVGVIAHGLLALIGVQRGDGEREAERLLERVLGYRMFADGKGRMNLSVADVAGDLLLVPQFTLPAPAAPPAEGERLFTHLLERAPRRPSAGRERSLRRPHAGRSHQRRAGHLPPPGQAEGLKAWKRGLAGATRGPAGCGCALDEGQAIVTGTIVPRVNRDERGSMSTRHYDAIIIGSGPGARGRR
jgi:D-aminoacyl-tRNA deacylase